MSEPIRSYRDLIAWQKAFKLGCSVHRLAARFPESERFGLTASLRREARQVAMKIAHGYGRGNTNDYIYDLKQARASVYELDTDLLFSLEFKHLDTPEYDGLKAELDECERVLAGLIRSLGG